jgi:hypothetical protein
MSNRQERQGQGNDLAIWAKASSRRRWLGPCLQPSCRGAAVFWSCVCAPCARCQRVEREGCPAPAYPQRVPRLHVCHFPCLGSVLNAHTLCCCAARDRSAMVPSASRPVAASAAGAGRWP